jgi:hypothetical protein
LNAIDAVAAIEQCVDEFDKKVFAICSDNENKMVSMRNIIESNYPDVITYGDSAHYLNLVRQAVTPDSLMKHIIFINKFFRNHQNAHDWLKEKNGMMPQLNSDTRWDSQKTCLQTYISNHEKYNQIVNDHREEMNPIVVDIGIYKQSLDLKIQLEVLGQILKKIQADAFDIWNDLLTNPNLQ